FARRRRARRARSRGRPRRPARRRGWCGAALLVGVPERVARARDAGLGGRSGLTTSVQSVASRRLDPRSHRWLAAPAILAALAAFASTASAAPADSASIAVEVRECAALDASRIRALFALELGRAADRLGDETLSVTCGPSETRLRIESSKMGWIERVLR